MPVMDGFDLISTLRRLQNDLAILAISGVYAGELLKAVKLLGAKAILEKPFELGIG
jgi:CheY-like chemotaxis protein